mmetsp:Transcript_70873/g.130605  ORF Transcript_70873/g.130605 Transcript_70873/m.130605 type:complete len:781 (+) Transcript_70873:108-2450(+)
MEVSLLEADGIPEGCLISVRAGSTRRQAPAEANKPCKLWFPRGFQSANPFKVDLLAPLGSTTLEVSPQADKYPIEVKQRYSGLPMRVTLRVREEANENSAGPELAFKNAPTAAAGSGQFGGIDAALVGSGHESPARRHQMAIDARSYLDEHNLLQWVQSLLQELIKDRPGDPWTYIDKQTAKMREKLGGEASKEAPPPVTELPKQMPTEPVKEIPKEAPPAQGGNRKVLNRGKSSANLPPVQIDDLRMRARKALEGEAERQKPPVDSIEKPKEAMLPFAGYYSKHFATAPALETMARSLFAKPAAQAVDAREAVGEALRAKACNALIKATCDGRLEAAISSLREKEQPVATTRPWIPHPCMFGANLGMAGTMHGAHLASASRSQPLSAAKKEAGPDEFMNAMRRHLEASAKSSEERADCPGDSPEAQRSPPAPLSRKLAPQSASSSVPSRQDQAKQECANPAGDFRQVPPSALSPLYSKFAPKKAELLAQPAQLATQDGVVTFGPGEYGPVRQVTPETPKAKPVSSDPSEGPRDQDEPKGLVQGLMGKVTELFYKAAPDHEAAAAEARKEAQVRLREKACAALTEASANGRLVQVLESVRGPALAPAAETQLVSIENKLTKSSDGWPTRQAPEDDVAESDEACSNVLRGTTEVCGRKFKVDAAFCEGCGNRRAEEGPASPSRMRSAKIDAPPPSDGQEDVGDQQDKLKAEVAAAKTSSDKFDVYLSKIQEALEQNSDEALVQPEEGKPSACCRAAPALCTAAAVVALAAASASSRRRNGL